MKHLRLIILFFQTWNYSFGQFSGTYTIGGNSPDFTTIKDAVIALNDSGISNSVIFNIRSGVYDERIPDIDFHGLANDTITFQSELLDSSTVTITNSYFSGERTFNIYSQNIIYRELKLTNPNVAVVLAGNCNIEFYKCSIIGASQAINTLEFQSGIISHCFELGWINVSNFYNFPISIDNCSLQGNIDITYIPIEFINNNVNGNISFGTTINTFINNNHINGHFNFDGQNSIIKNNSIIGFLNSNDIDGSGNQVINNDFEESISMVFSTSFKIIGNKFKEQVWLGHADTFLIINNFFFNNLEIAACSYCNIEFNNFSPDSGIFIDNQNGYNNVFENNNMPFAYYGMLYNTVINNNNYYSPSTGWYDTHPNFIPTMYVGANDLHSTNSQLMNKGIYNPFVLYDIDSTLRTNPPALGANEICMDDTLNVLCGDSIVITLCNLPLTGNYLWSPASGLNNSHLAQPTLSTNTSRMYYVKDIVSGLLDSIYIHVNPFNVDAGFDDSIKCGDRIILFTQFNTGAIYQWTPTDSLSAPDTYLNIANPSQTTTYVVTANVAGCGIFSDSITVFVNPLPVAYIAIDSLNHNYYSFINESNCADNYFWDFGDSTFSTDENPIHVYGDTGTFLVTMIACNSFGCDTLTGYVFIDSIIVLNNFNNLSNNNDVLNIYPNPNSGEFILSLNNNIPITKIELFNFLGDLILNKDNIKTSSEKINISNFTNGVYFLKITTRNFIETKKIIVTH